MRPNSLIEWEDIFFKQIQSKAILERKKELDFKNFISSIESNNSLPSPFEDQTEQFLNEFSPKIILSILDIRSITKNQESHYTSILQQYTKILPKQIALEFIIRHSNSQLNSPNEIKINNDSFIQAASKILIDKKSNYYLIFMQPNSEFMPENYQLICSAFATPMNLNLLTDYIQMDSMQSLKKIELIIKLVALTENYFHNNVKDPFAMITSGKIWNLIEPIEPRKINETNIDKDLTALAKIASSVEAISVVYQINIQFAIKMFKSGILAKQFAALSTINRISKLSPNAALPILKQENLLDYILTNKFNSDNMVLQPAGSFISQPIDDIHFELLHDIAEIFSLMYNHNLASDEHLKIIWQQTLTQSQATIGTFFKGLELILSSIPHENCFKTIIDTNDFPNSILPFLQKISEQCPMTLKMQLFNKLHDSFLNEKDTVRQNLLIDTMICYIPNNDEQFIHGLQAEYIENILNDKYINYSLKILQNSLYFLTKDKSSEILQAILARLNNDSVEYLEPLFKLISSSDITENEFSSIEGKVMQMINEHSKEVCVFYRQLIDSNVISNEQILSIFQKFCSLPFNSEIFDLIVHIFDLFSLSNQSELPILTNSESLTNNELIYSSIWKYLFATNRKEVVLFLVKIYSNSNDPNKALRFIESCSQNLNCIGSLEAIKWLIHHLEDGLPYDVKAPSNRLLFTTDFANVELIIEQTAYKIQVPKDICFEGFQRVVLNILHLLSESKSIEKYQYPYCILHDQSEKVTFRIDLLHDSTTLNSKCFVLKDGMQITVQANQNIISNANSFLFPFQAIIEHQYYIQLLEILNANDEILSEKALDILNLIPTLPTEISEFENLGSTSSIQWNSYLPFDNQFLLAYRLNMLGKYALNEQTKNAKPLSSNIKESLNAFYENGGIDYLLSSVFNLAKANISNNKCLSQLLKVTRYLLNTYESKNDCIDKVKSNIPSFLNWILEVSASNSNEQLFVDMIYLIDEMKSFLYDLDKFPELITIIIFHKLPNIRSIACSMANSIPDSMRKYTILISLLKSSAKTSRCDYYFDILSEMAKNNINSEQFWMDSVNSLYENFQMPKDSSMLNVLTFRPPPMNYTNGLFRVLNILADHFHSMTVDENAQKDTEKLFEFITTQIIFNQYKFYRPTCDIFRLYQLILDQNYTKSMEFLNPLIEAISNFKLTNRVPENYLSSTARNRGIKNLGATCYINSALQQLYNIPEFRDTLLQSKNIEDNWLYELQYDFVKLWLLPSNYINISNFVRCWRGYDNEIINPHEQQDAAEFLQLLLDRLEQVIPSITEIFKGTIEHITKGISVTYERKSTETFAIFPLEINNHADIAASFKTFLYPDRFQCIEKNLGKFEALRYHYITKPPKVLIIQLKRFNYDLLTKERNKINSLYSFPMDLDISPIMNDENKQKVIYDLCGIIHHNGSANSGHYFSDVKRETGKWLNLNDSRVRKIDSNSFLANGTEMSKEHEEQSKTDKNIISNSSNAYLLFYKMRDSNQVEANFQDETTESFISVDTYDDNQLDSKILDRLLNDIKNAILKAVSSTTQFSQLILNICRSDNQFEFLYKHTLNAMRINGDKQILEELINRCIQFCSTNSDIADFILKRETDFNEFCLYSEHSAMRDSFVKLIEASLKKSTEAALNGFYQFLYGKIVTSSNVIYERYNCMPSLFVVLDLTIKMNMKNIDLGQFLTTFTTFIFYTIQEYGSAGKKGNIISIVDFTVAFELMRSLISKLQNDLSKIEFDPLISSLASKLFSSSFITLVTITQTKNSNFLSFIEFLLQLTPDTKLLFNTFLDRAEREISIPLLAQLFNISLHIADQNLIIHFFAILKRRQSSSIVLFFENFLPICKSNRRIFVCNAYEWISKFLLSDDIKERLAIDAFVRKLFDDVTTQKSDENQNTNSSIKEATLSNDAEKQNETDIIDQAERQQSKATIVIIYQYLVDSVKLLVNMISRLKTNMPLIEIPIQMYPTHEYFDLLTWSAEITNTKDAKDLHIFVSLLKQFDTLLRGIPKFGASYPQLHCLQFLSKIYGKQVFVSSNLSEVINSIDKNVVAFTSHYYNDSVYTAINKLLIPILPNNPIPYFKSSLFSHLLYSSYTNEAAKFVESNANKSNVNIIITQLWNGRILKQNCTDNNIIYLQTSWKIMNLFIESCNAFYDSQNFIYLYKLLQQKSQIQRGIAKFLAAFNFAYWTLYQNQKSLFKLKTQSLYLKYKENGFNWQDIFDRMYNNEGLISPGNGGLCTFLRSMIALKTNPPKKLLKLVTKAPEPLMTTVIPLNQTAKLICDLCASFPDSGEAIMYTIREFASINSSFGNVEVFCQEFAKMKRKNFWTDLQEPLQKLFTLANDLDIAGETVLRMSEQLFDKKTLAQFRNKVMTLMVQKIRNVIKSHPSYQSIKKSEQKLKLGLVFSLDLSSWICDQMPALEIENGELAEYIKVLQSFKLANTTDKFFIYLSQQMRK